MHRSRILSGFLLFAALVPLACQPPAREPVAEPDLHTFSRAPLAETPYALLPIGAVKPEGWLLEELRRQANGMTGRLDEWYPTVGATNGWLGGDGDVWERGPYWLDGLVPLAYILEDVHLIEKARPYIEWTLASQREDGFFGPAPEEASTENTAQQQRKNAADWWPRMVMLKVLQQWYEATGDERVPAFMTNYFRYQLARLDVEPLGHWTGWATARGGENQASILWLYNLTGEPFLLELGQKIFEQSNDWTGDFEKGKVSTDYWYTHVVNVAMGIKQPAIEYLQTGDIRYLNAVRTGLAGLMEKHGQASGMFSGDELIHGTEPTRGTELCAVVELMFSLETLMAITGDVDYIDRLEKIAYNALPTQVNDDHTGRQYFQQVNQVRVSFGDHQLFYDGYQDALCYGLLTGYPCCTTNYHQGWPKFTRSLWLASQDRGLAALVYAPSHVTARVGADGREVTLREETNYPFEEQVRFVVETDAPTTFPLHLRIPAWAEGARLRINSAEWEPQIPGRIVTVDREWRDGDAVTLELPMAVRMSTWYERSVAVERGPLLYALPVDENKRLVDAPKPGADEHARWEMTPTAAWNYGLVFDRSDLAASFEVVTTDMPAYPWTADAVPVRIKANGVRIPGWHEYNGSAGRTPPSPVRVENGVAEPITLIPYGASTLRVAAFPEIAR
ncbi:MAG: glycoside hydrolase family 127 protein [Rhodothermales bacterium]